jgi:membrane protease YdiL (CAAX protease family)
LFVPVGIALVIVSSNLLLGASMSPAAELDPWYSLFLLFPAALIDAPLWEDSGWRGYALPRFSTSRSPLANSLILGVLLAGWHLPIALSEPAVTLPYLIATIASAVVTNWVYYNARESALLAILYHTSANTMGIYFSSMFSGPDQVRYFWLLAAVNCVVATALVLIAGPTLQRQPQAEAVQVGL